jgi:hypothetical protein
MPRHPPRRMPRQPPCRMPHSRHVFCHVSLHVGCHVSRHVGCHVNIHVIDSWTRGIIRDNICDVYFSHRYWAWVGLSGLRAILWRFRNIIDRANLWRWQKKSHSI